MLECQVVITATLVLMWISQSNGSVRTFAMKTRAMASQLASHLLVMASNFCDQNIYKRALWPPTFANGERFEFGKCQGVAVVH